MLGASKTISIAAPASYWYLKGFPIADMSSVVDYIVFMTHDLHGQWDYGSRIAAQGCPGGSCLRSHVNYTETVEALSIITKAGFPASKVLVNIGKYGRSFQMPTPVVMDQYVHSLVPLLELCLDCAYKPLDTSLTLRFSTLSVATPPRRRIMIRAATRTFWDMVLTIGWPTWITIL